MSSLQKPLSEIERNRKRPRITSTNGARVLKVFGDNARKMLHILKIVDDYNYFMGGVDITDQLRAAYSSHMPSRRTCLPLFFWLVDTSATNGYIVLSDIDSSWKNKHRNFKLEVAPELVGLLHERRFRTRSSADLEQSDLTPKKAKGA